MTSRALRPLLLLVAAAHVLAVLAVMASRIAYPFELEWIEGASLQQVQRVREGRPLYVRPSLEFTPLLYTPLYTYVSAAVASVLDRGGAAAHPPGAPIRRSESGSAVSLIGGGFLPLRLVSAFASIGSGILIFRVVRRETRGALPPVLAASLFAATFRASGAWMDVARVDALFVFLLLLTTALLRPDPQGSPGRPVLAGATLGLAVLTKQTGLVAAVVFGLYAVSSWPRRRTVAFLGTFLLAAGTAGLWLDHGSGGWFRYYAFGLAGRHHLAPVMLVLFWTQKVLAPLAIAGLAAAVYWTKGPGSVSAAPRSHHAWMAAGLIAVSLATHLTIGSYDNNLLPAYAALAILFGLGVDAVLVAAPAAAGEPLVFVACLIQFGGLFYNPVRQVPTREDRAAGERIVKLLAEVSGPVLAPRHPYLLATAGKATHAHEMTLADVLLDADGPVKAQLLAEVREAIRSRRYAAILQDDPFLIKDEVDENYRERERLFPDERGGFWPVTGSRTRPTVLLVPR